MSKLSVAEFISQSTVDKHTYVAVNLENYSARSILLWLFSIPYYPQGPEIGEMYQVVLGTNQKSYIDI